MKFWKKISMVMLLGIIFCAIAMPSAHAVSNSKIKAAYRTYLTGHTKSCKYFVSVNAGKKKEPILLTTNKIDSVNRSSISANVYYYNGKSVKATAKKSVSSNGSAYELSYKNNRIFIPYRWGGGTCIYISGGNLVGSMCYEYIPTGRYLSYAYKNGNYYNKKYVSKKTFTNFNKKWEGKAIKFHRNTSSNRNKYLKK